LFDVENVAKYDFYLLVTYVGLEMYIANAYSSGNEFGAESFNRNRRNGFVGGKPGFVVENVSVGTTIVNNLVTLWVIEG
jgi:hypothetical protein